MLELSIKSLAVGTVLASVLAVAANLLLLPAWSVYVIFVAILAASAYISAVEGRTSTGPTHRRPGARAHRPGS